MKIGKKININKSKIIHGGIIILFLALISVSSLAVNDLMGMQLTFNDTSQTGDVTFTIYDSASGGVIIYNETFPSNISAGEVDVMLGIGNELNLNYGQDYYMNIIAAGTDLTFNTADRQRFQSNIGNITSSYISPRNITSVLMDTSITISNELQATDITATNNFTVLGMAWLGNLVSSFINITHLVPTLDVTNYTGGNQITIAGHVISTSAIPKTNVAWTNESNTFTSNQLIGSGGYGGGGITLFSNGNGYFAEDVLIDGELITVNGNVVNGSFFPQGDLSFDLGNTTNRWDDLYIDEIFTNGNVGIGTTSPGDLLDVKDGHFALSDSDVAHGITDYATTNAYTHISPVIGSDGGALLAGLTDGTNGALQLIGYKGATGGEPAVEIFGRLKNGVSYQNIADATPLFVVSNGVTERLTILGNGNVGIGTTSPDWIFDVHDSSGNAYLGIGRATQSQGSSGLYIQGGTSGINWSIYQPANSDNLRFHNGTTDVVTIEESGNVGIGTTDPDNSFHIEGDQAGADFIKLDDGGYTTGQQQGILWEAGATKLGRMGLTYDSGTATYDFVVTDLYDGGETSGVDFIVQGDGNVGIGTTSPDAKLEVEGNVTITDTAGTGHPLFIDSAYDDASVVEMRERRIESAWGSYTFYKYLIRVGNVGGRTDTLKIDLGNNQDVSYFMKAFGSYGTGDDVKMVTQQGVAFGESVTNTVIASTSGGAAMTVGAPYWEGVNDALETNFSSSPGAGNFFVELDLYVADGGATVSVVTG
tara:strand:+ start:4659 stop:6944 length:2286 start_codon:yes stop_codon:yes gene_type:complete